WPQGKGPATRNRLLQRLDSASKPRHGEGKIGPDCHGMARGTTGFWEYRRAIAGSFRSNGIRNDHGLESWPFVAGRRPSRRRKCHQATKPRLKNRASPELQSQDHTVDTNLTRNRDCVSLFRCRELQTPTEIRQRNSIIRLPSSPIRPTS